MVKMFRAMCNKEAEEMIRFGSLSWNSKFKWFGTEEFVNQRVMDGRFNNSRFVEDRYNRLFEFEFSEESLKHFNKCGHREFMLNVRKVPLVKIISFKEI